jgi:hypothetical protein
MVETKASAGPAAEMGKKVDDAVNVVLETVRDARQTVEKSLPALSDRAQKVLHATSYYVGYGALTVSGCLAKIFSSESPVVSGFREGMAAAKGGQTKAAPQAAPRKAAPRKARPAAKRKAQPKQEAAGPAE